MGAPAQSHPGDFRMARFGWILLIWFGREFSREHDETTELSFTIHVIAGERAWYPRLSTSSLLNTSHPHPISKPFTSLFSPVFLLLSLCGMCVLRHTHIKVPMWQSEKNLRSYPCPPPCKIQGFFVVCRLRRVTYDQPVGLPASEGFSCLSLVFPYRNPAIRDWCHCAQLLCGFWDLIGVHILVPHVFYSLAFLQNPSSTEQELNACVIEIAPHCTLDARRPPEEKRTSRNFYILSYLNIHS